MSIVLFNYFTYRMTKWIILFHKSNLNMHMVEEEVKKYKEVLHRVKETRSAKVIAHLNKTIKMIEIYLHKKISGELEDLAHQRLNTLLNNKEIINNNNMNHSRTNWIKTEVEVFYMKINNISNK